MPSPILFPLPSTPSPPLVPPSLNSLNPPSPPPPPACSATERLRRPCVPVQPLARCTYDGRPALVTGAQAIRQGRRPAFGLARRPGKARSRARIPIPRAPRVLYYDDLVAAPVHAAATIRSACHPVLLLGAQLCPWRPASTSCGRCAHSHQMILAPFIRPFPAPSVRFASRGRDDDGHDGHDGYIRAPRAPFCRRCRVDAAAAGSVSHLRAGADEQADEKKMIHSRSCLSAGVRGCVLLARST